MGWGSSMKYDGGPSVTVGDMGGGLPRRPFTPLTEDQMWGIDRVLQENLLQYGEWSASAQKNIKVPDADPIWSASGTFWRRKVRCAEEPAQARSLYSIHSLRAL